MAFRDTQCQHSESHLLGQDGEGLTCCGKIISPRTNFSVEEIMSQIIPTVT